VITNVATGVITTVTTNSDGFYTAANLLPAQYNVTILGPRDTPPKKETGISLTVGAQQVFDPYSARRERFDRSDGGYPPKRLPVQLSSSDISAVVNRDPRVRELPLNGPQLGRTLANPAARRE